MRDEVAHRSILVRLLLSVQRSHVGSIGALDRSDLLIRFRLAVRRRDGIF